MLFHRSAGISRLLELDYGQPTVATWELHGPSAPAFTLVLLIRKMNDGFHLITQIILSTLTTVLSLGVCSNCVRKKHLSKSMSRPI